MSPLITIVTVTYNCVSILEETIQSVISQDYPNLEYIIIDGASRDGTIDMIKKYGNKLSYWISEPDKGIFDAMNKGLKAANGEWINFMNAGDRFCTHHVLSDLFNGKEYKDRIGTIFGPGRTITARGIVEHDKIVPFYRQKSVFQPMGFNHQDTFVRTSIAKKFAFAPEYQIAADYNMIRKMYEAGYDCMYVDTFISLTEGRTGLSATNRKKQRQEVARICKCEKTLYFRLYDFYYSFKHHLKRILER